MSLVVAQIHDAGLTLTGDTMITYAHDVTANRQKFRNAVPKIVLLDKLTAVGITGDLPSDDRILRDVVMLRGQPGRHSNRGASPTGLRLIRGCLAPRDA